MNTTLITVIAASVLLGAGSPVVAIPDHGPRSTAPSPVAVSYPFDAGSAALDHVAGQDWLPARRLG